MPLHPEAAAFLEQLAQQKSRPLESLPLDLTRRAAQVGSGTMANSPELASVANRKIPRANGTEIPVRITVPIGSGPFPVCLYFHGGGWVLNSIDTHDELVRHLTAASNCVFVNVEYRLAPEHKYPAALEDAWTALNWVAQHAHEFQGDANKIAVSGDSAGGNLAAVLCLISRDRKGPIIACQALIYPITDCDFERPSYRENAEGYFLTRKEMIWFWNQYVATPEQMREAYASPLQATSLKDLPRALILTAEYDPLRDEGEAYARALAAAGVETTLHRFDGMIHAFVRRVEQFSMAHEAIRRIAETLKSVFAIN